ncbi:hypothetical protein VTK73DRAFT_7844 [Phialemonium thermophilum]|uniref:Uncharacterized protein n=1 Tax=Phialemonium thermophilum TaxID=223376 RepID=A0ABR3WCC3_9PEZI
MDRGRYRRSLRASTIWLAVFKKRSTDVSMIRQISDIYITTCTTSPRAIYVSFHFFLTRRHPGSPHRHNVNNQRDSTLDPSQRGPSEPAPCHAHPMQALFRLIPGLAPPIHVSTLEGCGSAFPRERLGLPVLWWPRETLLCPCLGVYDAPALGPEAWLPDSGEPCRSVSHRPTL